MYEFIFFIFFCQKSSLWFTKEEILLKNNFWLDDNTLQIISKEEGNKEEVPFTLRRSKNCYKAKKKARSFFKQTYPKVDLDDIQMEIYYTMYTSNGGCKLIVRFKAPYLKDRIQ